MAKIHVMHRVVTRDENSKIVSDVEYYSFATGEPAYRIAAQSVPPGYEVTLQQRYPHGSVVADLEYVGRRLLRRSADRGNLSVRTARHHEQRSRLALAAAIGVMD